MGISDCSQKPPPTRLLEMLSDRFGAFEAIANSSIKLAHVAPEGCAYGKRSRTRTNGFPLSAARRTFAAKTFESDKRLSSIS
jgi:hypothetical protein